MSYDIIAECNGCAACVKVCPVAAIHGERKRVHVIDPAVCIDCGACGRICPYHAILDAAGALCQPVKRPRWPMPVIFEEKCVSCGLCLESCPTGVIEMDGKRMRPVARLVEPGNCIGCAFCEAICPVEAIAMRAGNGNG